MNKEYKSGSWRVVKEIANDEVLSVEILHECKNTDSPELEIMRHEIRCKNCGQRPVTDIILSYFKILDEIRERQGFITTIQKADKVSRVISALQKILEKHGDLPVLKLHDVYGEESFTVDEYLFVKDDERTSSKYLLIVE